MNLKERAEELLKAGYKPKMVANLLNISIKRLNNLTKIDEVKGGAFSE